MKWRKPLIEAKVRSGTGATSCSRLWGGGSLKYSVQGSPVSCVHHLLYPYTGLMRVVLCDGVSKSCHFQASVALHCAALLQSPSSRRQTIARALRPSRPSPVLRCEARRGEARHVPRRSHHGHIPKTQQARQSIAQTTCRAAGGRGEVLLHMQCPLVEQGYDRPQVPRPAAS